MDNRRTDEELTALVSATLGIPAALVVDELAFGSIPEWDSLNHVQLMLRLEASYGVEVDEDRMIALTDVRTIREFVGAIARQGAA